MIGYVMSEAFFLAKRFYDSTLYSRKRPDTDHIWGMRSFAPKISSLGIETMGELVHLVRSY